MVLLLLSPNQAQAESKKWKVLKGAYNIANNFLQSNSTVVAQGSFGYFPNRDGNNGGNGGGILDRILPNRNNQNATYNYQQPMQAQAQRYYTPQPPPSQYYPISNTQPQYQSQQFNGYPYQVAPQSQMVRPQGQVSILNGAAPDVITVLDTIAKNKGWNFRPIKLNNGMKNAYQISYGCTQYGKKSQFIVNQQSSGTELIFLNSNFLNQNELSEIFAGLNQYYPINIGQFQ